MPANRNASDVLNRDFFELRARILDLAAALDRIDRAAATSESEPRTAPQADPRREQLRQGIEILLSERPNRAEAVQLHFSYEYDPAWRERFGVVGPRFG